MDHRESRRYAPWIAYFQELDKRAGYGPALRPYLAESSLDLIEPYFRNVPSMLAGAVAADLRTYLPDDLMVKMDLCGMAHGLEARSPFLDQELVTWAATQPVDRRYTVGASKGMLKAAVAPLLPEAILNRPKKGFAVPLARWLRGELRDLAGDILLSPTAAGRGLFKSGYAQRLLSEHDRGVFDHRTRIWAMLMLELWYRTWADPPAGAEITARAAARTINADSS